MSTALAQTLVWDKGCPWIHIRREFTTHTGVWGFFIGVNP